MLYQRAIGSIRVFLKVFFGRHFGHFRMDDFWSKSSIKIGLATSLAWAAVASTVVIACQTWPESPYLSYIRAAVPEAIGSHLWNAIGAIAVMAFGLVLLFPRVARFARFADDLLVTTFGIGELMFGALLGELFSTEPPGNLSVLLRFLAYTQVSIELMACFALNFALWFAASLLSDSSRHARLVQKWRQTALWLRLMIAIALILLQGYFLVTAKVAPLPVTPCAGSQR